MASVASLLSLCALFIFLLGGVSKVWSALDVGRFMLGDVVLCYNKQRSLLQSEHPESCCTFLLPFALLFESHFLRKRRELYVKQRMSLPRGEGQVLALWLRKPTQISSISEQIWHCPDLSAVIVPEFLL